MHLCGGSLYRISDARATGKLSSGTWHFLLCSYHINDRLSSRQLPHLILCVKAIPIITFCTSLGALTYASPSINGMAVLGATVIACSLICTIISILNVKHLVSPEP